MFAQSEQVNLLIFLVPIAANTLKAAGSIGKTVCAYRNYPLIGGDKLAVHENLPGVYHLSSCSPLNSTIILNQLYDVPGWLSRVNRAGELGRQQANRFDRMVYKKIPPLHFLQ